MIEMLRRFLRLFFMQEAIAPLYEPCYNIPKSVRHEGRHMMSTEELPIWMRKDLSNPEIARDVFHENAYQLVPFLVQDGRRHKAAIICPGGGYNMVCSYIEGEPYARALNALGISAVVVYYRCRELAHYPAPQDDLARAVREVHLHAQEWNLDMDGYSVWGSSAGGHLAGSFGTDNMGYSKYGLPKPGSMVLVYPVITMGMHTHEGTRNNLIGPDAAPELQEFSSIERHVTADYPPTFLWCGSADSCVPPENSRLMANALHQSGVPYQFEEYPGVEHGVGLGKGLSCEGWFEQAVDFWMSRLG